MLLTILIVMGIIVLGVALLPLVIPLLVLLTSAVMWVIALVITMLCAPFVLIRDQFKK